MNEEVYIRVPGVFEASVPRLNTMKASVVMDIMTATSEVEQFKACLTLFRSVLPMEQWAEFDELSWKDATDVVAKWIGEL